MAESRSKMALALFSIGAPEKVVEGALLGYLDKLQDCRRCARVHKLDLNKLIEIIKPVRK